MAHTVMQNWSDIPAPTPAPSQPQGTANMQAAAKKSNEMAQAGSDLLRRTTFLGQIPVGPEQTTLSILSKADVGRLGPVNQAMMGVLHADDLSTEAFLDQLERSQEQGIPMSFAEHQKCTKLIEDKYNKRYILHGRNASRSMLPIEKRLAAMIRHLDCTDGKFGDYEIHTIVERYPNLNSLNVSSKKSNNITDKALALIAKLSCLQSLQLAYQPNITAAGLAHLNELPLKALSLQGCKIGDAAVSSLANLSNTLEYLDLSFPDSMSDWRLSAIVGPALSSLNLTYLRSFSNEIAALLATLPLKELNLDSSGITNQGLARLKNLSSLTHLNLTSCYRLTAQGLTDFFKEAICPLEYLVLDSCDKAETDNCIGALARFPNLTHLGLSRMGMTNKHVSLLRALPRLAHLDISGNYEVTPEAKEAFQHLLSLQSLNLEYCASLLTDEGMEALTVLSRLEELNLGCSRSMTEKGLGALSSLPLKTLRLHNCLFRNPNLAIKTMAEAFSLRFLDLRIGLADAPMTDETAQALNLLLLEHLIIRPNHFTKVGENILRQMIPYVEATDSLLVKRPIPSPFPGRFQLVKEFYAYTY